MSLSLACLGLALFAGCGGPSRGGRGGPPELQLAPVPPLAGLGEFFDGTLLVELTTSAFSFKGREPGKEGKSGGRPGGGGGMSGSFGPMGGGMRGGPGGGGGRGPGGGGDGPGQERLDPEQQRISNIQRHVSMRPPVIIHLRLTNRGPAPITARIADFLSPIGNYAVRPESLPLEPGQSLETEPMASQLAGELAEVPVTLTVRIPGRKETKTILLKAVPETPPAPPEKSG